MIDRVKLRQQYKQETGEDWKMLQSTAQPTVDYTKWLEDRLTQGQELPISNVVGRSEQFYCDAKKCNNSKGEICNGYCKGLSDVPPQ